MQQTVTRGRGELAHRNAVLLWPRGSLRIFDHLVVKPHAAVSDTAGSTTGTDKLRTSTATCRGCAALWLNAATATISSPPSPVPSGASTRTTGIGALPRVAQTLTTVERTNVFGFVEMMTNTAATRRRG
jgi:hypothetical protein